jgi:uncharacterized membrane protein YciS (DUF1049 family)
MMFLGIILLSIVFGRLLERYHPAPMWATAFLAGIGIAFIIVGYIREYRRMRWELEQVERIIRRQGRNDET